MPINQYYSPGGGGASAPAGGSSSGLLDFLWNVGTGIYDRARQAEDINWQRDSYLNELKWSRNAQQITWDREDNAVQRRAADMSAAGINPLLAAGNAAQASSPINLPTAPNTPDRKALPRLDALALYLQKQQIGVTQAQTRLINANADRQQLENSVFAERQDERRGSYNQQKERHDKTIDKIKEDIDSVRHNLLYARAHNFPVGSTNQMVQTLDYLLKMLDSVLNSVKESPQSLFGINEFYENWKRDQENKPSTDPRDREAGS